MKLKEAYENLVASKKYQWKDSTVYKYQYLFQHYLDPYFKDLEIEAIDDQLLEMFFQSLNLSNNTKILIRNLLKQILEPYNKRVYPPIHRLNQEIEVLTSIEQKEIVDYIFSTCPTPLNAGILLGLYDGLRLGEICALSWEDIDFQEQSVSIQKTVIRLPKLQGRQKSSLMVVAPKSLSSYRKIPIPSKVIHYLHDLPDQQGYLLNHGNKPLDPRSYEYYFERLLKKANIRKVKFHSLRHTFATRCIEKGIDIKTVSEILGHSDISVTIKYYVKSSFEFKKRQIEKLIDD